MRKSISTEKQHQDYLILIVDDDQGIIDSLTAVLKRHGYRAEGTTDPLDAVEKVRRGSYDLLILDFLMSPLHGDKVVEQIRTFNKDLYILLLTGYKDLAPPLETIKKLAIQGYCEKSDRFDQIILLVESGVKSIAQIRTIQKFSEGLNKILQSVPSIYQLQPIGDILEQILRELLPLLDSENAFILVDNYTNIDGKSDKSFYKGIGTYHVDIEDFLKSIGHDKIEQIGHARVSMSPVRLEDGIILPLVNEYGISMGVIYAELGSGDIEEGLRLLRIYASQAASSINNAFLHSLINEKNEELTRTYDLLKERYMDTIEALRLVVDAKDIHTRGHSDRVSFYALKVGERMGLDKKLLETLRIGGLFHDVGKIGTSDDILIKQDKLSDAEYEEVKKHTIKGAHILSAVSMFKDIVPIVRHHHEHVDGSGYPDGLQGDAIPLLTRIISVVDAFDAMMSDRQHREKLGFEAACRELKEGAGTQFDKDMVDIFLQLTHHVNLHEQAPKYETRPLEEGC